MQFYLTNIRPKLQILNCYEVKFFADFRVISRLWKATMAK